jgi:hypothetical protein
VSSSFRQAEERRKAEREAQRREEALEAKREEARERAREEAREAEREAERREAARAEADAERKAAEKAAARRATALARRRAEAAALRQELVQAARRAEERAAARRGERRAAARDEERRQASRDEQREQQRAEGREHQRGDERAQERRQAARDEERAEQRERRRAEERAEQRRRVARDEQREQQRTAQRRQAAREEERGEEREQERANEREQQRAAERAEGRRQAARADEHDEQREQDRRERARAERREEERRRDRSEQLRTEAVAQRRDEVRAQQRRTAVRTSTLDARRTADRDQSRAAQLREAALRRRTAAGDGGGGGGGTGPGGGSGWLRVVGRTVVDESGAPVVLRGVTVHALERPEPAGEAFAPALHADDAALMAAWGCTTVTVPIAQDLALEGRGDAWGEDYLTALDATVATATAAGLRAIVQLSLLSSELPSAPGRFAPPVPDAASIDLWAHVARRYADEPGVLFDLFATPHDPDPGDWTALVMPRLTWPVWERWVLAMLGEVKRVHPRALAIVRGLGGSDLSGFPLPYADGSRIPNLLYAAKLAGEPIAPLAALRRLARRAPVAASPWRAGAYDGRVVEVLGRRLADVGAHWTAARWREPEAPLAAQAAGTLAPTPLGRAFQVALAQPPPASSLRAPRVGPGRA